MQATIFFNGRIHTCDPQYRTAAAFGVRNGRIVAVGDERSVREAAGPGHQAIDLKGSTVMPGVIDIHNHHTLGGRAALFELNISSAWSYDEILVHIRKAAQAAPAGRWVFGGGFDSGLADRLNTSQARADLDAVSAGKPVVLRDDSAHNRWCNSAALAAAGITASTKDPANGRIGRDAQSGAPTGFLLESAGVLVDEALEDAMFSDASVLGQVVVKGVEILNSLGVTAFQDALSYLAMIQALSELDRAGKLTAWVTPSLMATGGFYTPGPIGAPLFAEKEKYRTEHVRPNFAKVLLDGVPMTRTAAMLEPYREDSVFGCCYRGGTTMTLPQLARLLADCERVGLAVKIHCAGDGASRQALDAIEVVRNFNGPTTLRHQIAHALIIDLADVPRMAALNVTADLSPMLWCPSILERALRGSVPDKRIDIMAPIADMLKAGVLIAGGSDWPVAPSPDPWLAMEGMVTRRDPLGQFPGALGPEQAISVDETMFAFTRGGAIALGLDDKIGSLETGKVADFIVIDQDIKTCAPDRIADTKVLSTWFGGNKVYER
ncbi:MAG TPA: amidohydrolase [Steroidobacteraceae bacterium]|nr:amidohydrolase [Steroidobacteraceae bacterium]